MTGFRRTAAGLHIGDTGDKVGMMGATPVTRVVVTGAVQDDDSAASNGTAVNIVPENNGIFAYLESTTAGNADTTFLVGADGPAVVVNDNDSPGGVQLYFDEDAASFDSRFLCVSPTAQPLFLVTSTGDCIRVAHDASAASNGVAIYIDDNAASAHEKLLFVSPTDADGSYTTDDQFSLNQSGLIATS